MMAVLAKDCPLKVKADVVRLVTDSGFRVHVSELAGVSVIGVMGEGAETLAETLRGMPGVTEVRTAAPPYPLVARDTHPERTRVFVGDVAIGGEALVVAAGPCSVESEEQMIATAASVSAAGAQLLRGGAFKPRTSPYSFQGLGREGLEILAEARRVSGLPVVTEVVAAEDVDLVARYADVLQVGARNMQNFRLLQAVGEQQSPVLLKRGMSSTLEEFLLAAEYIVAAGNPRVILCERGIRTFETSVRNTLDICAIPVLRERTHLPVLVDPSHAAGRREIVPALALAAVAAGADGLLVEVHPHPEQALSDGRQSLTLAGFARMMLDVRSVARAVNRDVAFATV